MSFGGAESFFVGRRRLPVRRVFEKVSFEHRNQRLFGGVWTLRAIQRVRLPLAYAHRRAAESAFHPGKLQAGRRRSAFHRPVRPPFSACMVRPVPPIMGSGAARLHHTFSGAVPCPAGAACLNLTPRLNFTQTLSVREPGFRHATSPHRQETKPARTESSQRIASICGVASRR
jgi:hypothetical protein